MATISSRGKALVAMATKKNNFFFGFPYKMCIELLFGNGGQRIRSLVDPYRGVQYSTLDGS